MSVALPLVAHRRLVFREFFIFLDENLTTADFAMQVRLVRDAPGTALADLGTVTDDSEGIRLMYAGTATVAAHITAGRLTSDFYAEVNPATGVNYDTDDNVLLSQLRVIVGGITMGNMPAPDVPDIGDDVELAYDLLVTRAGGFAIKEFYGPFTVQGTVTVP